jgi:outer membrane protein, heavy metal efflux system
MRVPPLSAALLAVLLPAVAGAQTVSLTETEALARVSDESPRVRALRSPVDIARSDVLGAARWPNPRFTFDREAVAGAIENIVTIAQPLPVSGRRGFEVRAATALVDAASSRSADALRRVRSDVRLAFAELIAAQKREREYQAAQTQLQEAIGVLARREAAGDVAGFDRLRAERELFDLNADQAAAAVDRARAQAALTGFFIGVAPTALIAVESPPASAPLPSLDALVERAEAARGDLAAFRHEATAARLSQDAAARRRIPEPEVIAGTKSSSFGGGDIGSVLSVQATVPLFDRGRPERALALARERQASALADMFRQTLRAEIAALRETVTIRREAAARYRDTALGGVEQIERIARVSYEAGERGILELLDAYRTGVAAALRQDGLDLAVRQAEIELEFVSGWEIP